MSKTLKAYALKMRKDPTRAERIFHYQFRDYFPHIFIKPQHIIDHHIVDFYIPDLNLIIEIDGGQHCNNKADQRRDKILRRKGYRIQRYWNNDITENLSGVFEDFTLKYMRK